MMDDHLSKWTVHVSSPLKTLIFYFISWESFEKILSETKLIFCSNNSEVAFNDETNVLLVFASKILPTEQLWIHVFIYYKVVFKVTESNSDSLVMSHYWHLLWNSWLKFLDRAGDSGKFETTDVDNQHLFMDSVISYVSHP